MVIIILHANLLFSNKKVMQRDDYRIRSAAEEPPNFQSYLCILLPSRSTSEPAPRMMPLWQPLNTPSMPTINMVAKNIFIFVLFLEFITSKIRFTVRHA